MTAALEGGEWSAARPGRTLPSGKTRYPLYRRLGGPQGRSGKAENLVPTGIRSRTVQPVAQSLYRLTYPAHASTVVVLILQDIQVTTERITLISNFCRVLRSPSKTHYWRKDRGMDRRDGKTRKKCKQLLDDLKEKRGYWKLEEEALDHALCRIRFGKCCGPVVRRTTERTKNEWVRSPQVWTDVRALKQCSYMFR